MGCLVEILRSVLALVLGVIVFFGFLFLLLLNNFSDKLLSPEFYIDTIVGENTYNRVYDEVLLDQELLDTTQDLLGGVQVVTQEDIVMLLRQIVPPDYLQSQVEGSIHRTVDYFNEDRDTLDLYIDLGPPLNNVKPVLFQYIDQRIEQLPVEEPLVPRCDPEILSDVAKRYEAIYRGLAKGVVPESIPSFRAIAAPCRVLIYDIVFEALVRDADLDRRVRAGLEDKRSEIRNEFFEGDTTGVWKVAVPAVATPLIDDAIARVREELDDQDRLDLIHQLALWNEGFTEAELRSDIDTSRKWLNRGRTDLGKPAAWAMLIAGSILMGLIYYPSLKNALRWPGVTLFLTGLVFFVTGKVVESQVPDELRNLVERGANEISGVPTSVTDLGGDLLVSFGKQLTGGIDGPALTLLIIGALLFGASFFAFLLGPLFLPVTTSRLVLRMLGIIKAPFRRGGGQPPAQGPGDVREQNIRSGPNAS